MLACRMAVAEPLPADDRPRLPCALEAPWPPYPTIGSAPIARAWVIQDEYGLGCADWPRGTPVVVVALAARVSGRDALSDIVQRFAAVSAYSSIRYWSVTGKRWGPLLARAHALAGNPDGAPRTDFSPAELRQGSVLWFAQRDNRATTDVTYRMSVLERHDNRLVISIVNQTAIHWHFVTPFDPGTVLSYWFITRETADVWDYYYVMLAAGNFGAASRYTASYINRAVAYYRYSVGIPTDRDPPAAP